MARHWLSSAGVRIQSGSLAPGGRVCEGWCRSSGGWGAWKEPSRLSTRGDGHLLADLAIQPLTPPSRPPLALLPWAGYL